MEWLFTRLSTRGSILYPDRADDRWPQQPRTRRLMSWLDWYNSLAKPSWTPTPSTIGLIWQILYPIILVSFGFVFVQAIRRKVPWLVALPFVINLVANLIFTPIQFGLRSLPLASVDILIVLGTIIWMMAAIWRSYRWVVVAQVPYLLWVGTATVLQLSITVMNW
jgi:tryptophan-rich sensory protein